MAKSMFIILKKGLSVRLFFQVMLIFFVFLKIKQNNLFLCIKMEAVKQWVYIILFLIKKYHLEKTKVPQTADNKVLSEEYFISPKHSQTNLFRVIIHIKICQILC